jgi:hypothetical protein
MGLGLLGDFSKRHGLSHLSLTHIKGAAKTISIGKSSPIYEQKNP